MEKPKDKSRLEILKKIAEYEKSGLFDIDVEPDPPSEPLKPQDVDFLNKKFSSKIKTAFANFCARLYFNNLLRKKQYIFSGVTGLENLKGFSGGALVTCNHFNAFDNYAVYLGLKKHFKGLTLYKIIRGGNYFLPGLFGFFMRNCNTLPLSENNRTMINCRRAVDKLLADGNIILIYPEKSMWWNYRKPRPYKSGAFKFAVKNNKPVIPCFITLKDSSIIGCDGFPVQEYTVNILPLIYPDSNLPLDENCENMKNINFELCRQAYEKIYGKELKYTED